ncbi:TlpA disulfide reductase family protein [uncultured Tenacibaculum sp.]|uniref:TlpA family protein disulfide reductase n=1 Tax=uncultured Tenacibaculum sp. TaxID=174713 RepID=UPI0026302772|nr:TlpA disulfide reductase family protein [uncultured Tenacibaculum sp.]
MKKVFYLFCATAFFFSCKNNDFVTFSGKIENKNSDSLVVANPQKAYSKTIKINEDGTFKDTLKVDNGFFSLFDGKNYATTYLRNGDEIVMTINAADPRKTILFAGKGAAESNFIATTAINQIEFNAGIKELIELPKAEFDTKLGAYVSGFRSRLSNKILDTAFVSIQTKSIDNLEEQVTRIHGDKIYFKTVLAKGKPAPKFSKYETPDRTPYSLDDFKGKYVFIDVWATWCPPCLAQIPYLQKLEEEYKGKNIEFISISIDKRDDYFTWNDMVDEKNLGGIQLFANEDLSFTKAYNIQDIPRFIFIDPDGNIISADAPRPSDPALKAMFAENGV